MRIYLFPLLSVFTFLVPAPAESPTDSKQVKGPAIANGNIELLWRDLADPDAAKAYRAIWALAKTPKETVAFIGANHAPTPTPDASQVQRWIEGLNSENFAMRDKANAELAKLGGLAESAMRVALKAKPSLETQQRLEKLLNRLLGPITRPDHLREVRAVETLEHIGTDAAKALLAKYAAGASGSRWISRNLLYNLVDTRRRAFGSGCRLLPGCVAEGCSPPRNQIAEGHRRRWRHLEQRLAKMLELVAVVQQLKGAGRLQDELWRLQRLLTKYT